MKTPYKQLFYLILLGLLCLVAQPVFANESSQTDGTASTVSGKTFVNRNDIWIDTDYDPVKHPLYKIGIYSDEYNALQASIGARTLKSYRRLGDRLLVVHDGWGIELENSAEAGPVVASETRKPAFLQTYQPIVENPPRVVSSGTGNQAPNLIASSQSAGGINIHIHIGWGEFFGIILLVALIGLGVWLGLREPVSENL